MDILINNEKLEFSLENEKNLNEVIDSVEKWVLKNGRVISSISADDVRITLDSPSETLHKGVNGISLLKIQTLSPIEYALHTLETIGEYIVDFKSRYLQSARIENHDAVLEGLMLVENGLSCACSLLLIKDFAVLDENGVSLQEMLGGLHTAVHKFEKHYIDTADLPEITGILDGFLRVLPRMAIWTVIKNGISMSKPQNTEAFYKSVLADLCSVAQRSVDKFENIGKNLQIGKDAPALHDILFITELLDELVFMLGFFMQEHQDRMDGIRVSGKIIREVIESISKGLKEIEESFKNGDMVSVGDMIEYELKPLYEDVLELIEKISDII